MSLYHSYSRPRLPASPTCSHARGNACPHRREVLLPAALLQRRVHPLDHHRAVHTLPHKGGIERLDGGFGIVVQAHGHQTAALEGGRV